MKSTEKKKKNTERDDDGVYTGVYTGEGKVSGDGGLNGSPELNGGEFGPYPSEEVGEFGTLGLFSPKSF